MTTPEDLLAMPRDWEQRHEAWARLTGGDTLFQALHAVVRSGTAHDWGALQHLVTEWREDFVLYAPDEAIRRARLDQWLILHRLVWCAEQAAQRPEAYRTEVDRACLALAEAPEFLRGYEEWAWGCIRTFLDAPQRGQPVVVAVTLLIPRTQSSRVGTFQLEVLDGGAGAVFHHPADALVTRFDEEFGVSTQAAWRAARALAQERGVDVLRRDGRWRLLTREGQPLAQVQRRSASGAAARGWWFALQGKVPDEGVIVVAAMDDQGSLAGVSGLGQKVKAIAQNGRIDTIVVANAENQSQARDALRELFNAEPNPVEVRRAETLERLVGTRSQLVAQVLNYLETLAKDLAELPPYYPGHLRAGEEGKTRFDEIRQIVQVIQDRAAFERWLAEMRERMQAAGEDFDRLAYAPVRARPQDEHDGIFSGRPAAPQAIEWDERAGGRFKRAIILGDPGFGKTWLLRYEARRLANEAAVRLREKTISLEEMTLPILIRLSDLNRSDDPIQDSLVDRIAPAGPETFRDFVRGKLETDRCSLLLDAWDEVPVEVPRNGQPVAYAPHHRQRLGQRLDAFARQFQRPRILLTSRIVGYTDSPIPDAQELEILAFDTPQIEAFARVWFGDDGDPTGQFLANLEQKHQVRGLARIPLMLGIMCRAYQEKQLTFPSRRGELYERCLRGLLRDWKEEKQARPISAVALEHTLRRLAAAALRLHGDGREQFSETQLAEALGFNLDEETEAGRAARFIESLKAGGVLITAGEHRDAPLLFLHRTFHEYLAARALGHQANREGWPAIAPLVDKKAWDPTWREVICLLAGRVAKPMPLLEMLSNPEPTETNRHGGDLFHSRLALAALCLPELPSAVRNSQSAMVDEITTATFSFWWQLRLHGIEAAAGHVARALSALGQINARVDGTPLLE